jgi:hypothetical protein
LSSADSAVDLLPKPDPIFVIIHNIRFSLVIEIHPNQDRYSHV